MLDLNQHLFTKEAPRKKLMLIDSATQSELFNVTEASILRIIKEVGRGSSLQKRNKYKRFVVDDSRGNEWNSHLHFIYNTKEGHVFMEFYIQGDDTDTDDGCLWHHFNDPRYESVCVGKLTESWDYGYAHTISANYDREDRQEVIRTILKDYIRAKYADKLKLTV